VAEWHIRAIIQLIAECSKTSDLFSWALPGILQALDVGILFEVAWEGSRILSLACLAHFVRYVLRYILLVGVRRQHMLVNADIDNRVTLRLADPINENRVLRLSC
jgi:hypothetical protein